MSRCDCYDFPTWVNTEGTWATEWPSTREVPQAVYNLLCPWEEQISGCVDAYWETDDGDGNPYSWRGYGYCFPESPEFDSALKAAVDLLNYILDKEKHVPTH